MPLAPPQLLDLGVTIRNLALKPLCVVEGFLHSIGERQAVDDHTPQELLVRLLSTVGISLFSSHTREGS
jgi:hypothetical protein